MNNITADHLARRACVYVRQSTPGQVQNNRMHPMNPSGASSHKG
jgi:hypothetical protein